MHLVAVGCEGGQEPERADVNLSGGASSRRWWRPSWRLERTLPDGDPVSTGPDPDELSVVITAHLEAGSPTGWFEPWYAAVRPRSEALPWHADGPHPYVIDLLERTPHAPSGGASVVVVGCGLGDDAAALADLGYDVTAFDVAPTAIAWARERHPTAAVDWRVADLLAPPEDLLESADLVVEVHTADHLPGVVRDLAMQAAGRLVAPGGILVAISLLATRREVAEAPGDPPWAQPPSALAAYQSSGLVRVSLDHPAPDGQGTLEARIVCARPTGRPLLP